MPPPPNYVILRIATNFQRAALPIQHLRIYTDHCTMHSSTGIGIKIVTAACRLITIKQVVSTRHANHAEHSGPLVFFVSTSCQQLHDGDILSKILTPAASAQNPPAPPTKNMKHSGNEVTAMLGLQAYRLADRQDTPIHNRCWIAK